MRGTITTNERRYLMGIYKKQNPEIAKQNHKWVQAHFREYIENNHIYESCDSFAPNHKRWPACPLCVSERVVFAKDADRTKTHHLYRLYKEGHEGFVYIGISSNPAARFKQHVREKDVDLMQVFRSYDNRMACEIAEYIQIRRHRPLLNREYNGDKAGLHRYKVVGWQPV